MSTAGSVVGSSKYVTFDRALLIFISLFLLSHAVAYYVSMHTDRIIETIILNLLLILMGGIVAIVLVVRIVILILFAFTGTDGWHLQPCSPVSRYWRRIPLWEQQQFSTLSTNFAFTSIKPPMSRRLKRAIARPNLSFLTGAVASSWDRAPNIFSSSTKTTA